jgi:4-diphosphocytidyl-2-C-methyl-D-erythritol kinase
MGISRGMKSIIVQAPAKLNLTLNITGRRTDGYHLLDSMFVFCGLHDVIMVEADDSLRFAHTSGPFVGAMGAIDDNLVMRAARMLQTEAGIHMGAHISLVKNIPVAAGLGGGSADAAATLNALNHLWGLNWSPARLEALAAQLGADIPACIQSMPVIARGIGDLLSPAPTMPQLGLLLVNPLVPTPTPAVFKVFAEANPVLPGKTTGALPSHFTDLAELVAAIAPRGNDLTDAAISVQPVIADVLASLRVTSHVKHVGLSGSGASCFALYDNIRDAEEAGERLKSAQPIWWCWVGGLY